ncbi:MAG: hypothetical protein J2P25_05775 [Nocardiopsaceae bacterium]|nr:hypothetical protein [Nocardiopsaceae bacterium]
MRELVMPVISGADARTRRLKLLRGACLVTLLAIAVQFGVGMILNFYGSPPSNTSSWLGEVETAPAMLTVHALIGLLLLVGAVLAVIQAIAVRYWPLIATAAVGFVALLGAFVAGEAFIKSGSDSESLTMALLASVALLCFIVAHTIAHTTARRTAG